jgi:hypothetical protein
MGCFGDIARGFRLVHDNWPLILIQAVMIVMGIIGLIIFVGIPVVAAFVSVGMDAAELGRMEKLLDTLEDPSVLVSEYLSLAVVTVLSVFVYLVFWSLLWIYVLGGSAGVLGRALKEPAARFSIRGFFSEAKRLFFPLTGYAAIVGLIVIGAALMLGVLGFAAALAAEAVGPSETTTGFFFRVLLTLSFGTVSFILIFLLGAVGAVGMAPLVLEGTGPMESLDRGFRHVRLHTGSLRFLGVLLAGYLGIYLLAALTGYGIRLAGGLLLSLPYQFAANIFQGYISLVALAAVLAHFFATTCGGSTRCEDTSAEEAPQPVPPPPGSEPT